MTKIQISLPEMKDAKDKEEVRKALFSLVDQLNKLMAEIEARLAALEP